MNLDVIRKKIDVIDDDIVRLVAKRQSYMPAIGKYKKDHKYPIVQPGCEKKVINSRKKLAKSFGVDADLIQKIFQNIFKNSRKIQKNFLKLK